MMMKKSFIKYTCDRSEEWGVRMGLKLTHAEYFFRLQQHNKPINENHSIIESILSREIVVAEF